MESGELRKLLTGLSRTLIALESIRPHLDSDALQSGWLGNAPATDQEIEDCQRRLGTILPKSYVEFLKVSNEWKTTGSFLRLLPVSEIQWLKYVNPKLIETWKSSAGDDSPERDIGECLAVSADGDAICLLNPNRKFGNGEWEAWFFADWIPGANKYRSFTALLKQFARDARQELAGQKQARKVDSSLPSINELAAAQRESGWQGPEKYVDGMLALFKAKVRDPQYRWSIAGALCTVRMSPEQYAAFVEVGNSDPDKKVRKHVQEVIKSRTELWANEGQK